MKLARLLPSLLGILLLFAPVPAMAQALAGMLAGSWALKVEGTVMFRFDIERTGDSWSGTWTKPRTFVTDGASFGNLSGPASVQQSLAGRTMGEWAELTFGDPRPGGVPDVFRFRLTGLDTAEMIYADTGLAAFVLERVDASTAPGPWDLARVYRRAGVVAGKPVSFSAAPALAPRPAPTLPPPRVEQGPPAMQGR